MEIQEAAALNGATVGMGKDGILIKHFIAIYYNGTEEECSHLYSVCLTDAIREAENALCAPYHCVEVVEYIQSGESIDHYNSRIKEYAKIDMASTSDFVLKDILYD